MIDQIYKTKEDVVVQAEKVLHKTLRDIIPDDLIAEIQENIDGY